LKKSEALWKNPLSFDSMEKKAGHDGDTWFDKLEAAVLKMGPMTLPITIPRLISI
jgi:hypothetical protein